MNRTLAGLTFDRFYRYDEYVAFLHAFEREYSGLVSIEVIGKSWQGRDIHVATLTNRARGPADEKPAVWIDANIHSSEVAGGAAALYFMRWLLQGHGLDADATRALDTRTFYICPRINPDGVEAALADTPCIVRSSMRPYPFDEDPVAGLVVQDIDGDGRVLSMRIPDPNGAWKTHPLDARLMIRRDPAEVGGEYYRVVPEGLIEAYDGLRFAVSPHKEGLDLNRNFPANWRQEFEQLGAGDFPTSEPEVRAVVDFLSNHRNVGAATSFHTFSGVLLRPFSGASDDDMKPEDLWVYKKMGSVGTSMTGYPALSTYHDFRYHPKDVITGTFDWLFEHLGAFSWTIEVWSPMREAGIEQYDPIHWFRDHSPDDDLAMIRWNDEKLHGQGYVDWKPFDHPQLGRVEIGGWDRFRVISNPTPELLEREIAKFPRWLLWQALILPSLAVRDVCVEGLGASAWRVRLVVQNTGWLPTSVSHRAAERKVVRGVIAEIELPAGCRLRSGQRRVEIGQLSGWSEKHTAISFWPEYGPMADVGVAEWIVEGDAGVQVELMARHERAGKVRARVALGETTRGAH